MINIFKNIAEIKLFVFFFKWKNILHFSSQQLEDMPHGMSQACMCKTFRVFMLIFFLFSYITWGRGIQIQVL